MSDTLSDTVTLSQARLAIPSGDNDQVAALYKALVEQNPDDKQVIDEATSVLGAMGRTEDAVAILENTMSRLSDSPFLLKRMAEIFDASDAKVEKAQAWRRIAAVSSPPQPKIALAWGDAAAAAELYDEAIEAYRKGIALTPEAPILLHRLAQVLVLSGDRDTAVAELAQNLKPEVDYVLCYVLLADILAKNEQLMDALSTITVAVSLDPTNVRAICARGETLLRLNQPALAAAAFTQALTQSPDDIQSLMGLGVAESRQDNLMAAIYHMAHILRMDPSNTIARQRKSKWRQMTLAAPSA